jgi:hypothetical protein
MGGNDTGVSTALRHSRKSLMITAQTRVLGLGAAQSMFGFGHTVTNAKDADFMSSALPRNFVRHREPVGGDRWYVFVGVIEEVCARCEDVSSGWAAASIGGSGLSA